MQKSIHRRLSAVFIAIPALALSTQSPAAQQTATWLGSNGYWSDATKWTGGVVPNNTADTTYAVNIDGGNPAQSKVQNSITYPPTNYVIDALTIDAGDSLAIGEDSLQINKKVTNHGTLSVLDGHILLPPDSIIGSDGNFGVSGYASLASASGSLTIEPGATIVGGWGIPILGSTTTRLINHADLYFGGQTGDIVFAGSTIDNQGSFTAANGASLGFDTDSTLDQLGKITNSGGQFVIYGTLENTGRTFKVDHDSGQWVLNGTIHGGSIETDDGFNLIIPFSSIATLDDVTINGEVTVADRLEIPAGQTINGHGEIVISGAEAPEGDGTIRTKSGTTIIGSGMTIRGGVDRSFPAFAGQATIGNPGSTLVNHGIIHVDPISQWGNGQSLQLAGNTINDGSLEVTPLSAIRALGNLAFIDNGKLLIDGGGELDVFADLDLSTDADFLGVYPQAGGQPYDQSLIATYGGKLSGVFDHVTPGITVDYSTAGQILISGTPVPEPASAVMEFLAGAIILETRRSSKAR